ILTFTAHEGGKVEIRCPYEPKYEEHKKYLCRGECPRVFKDKPVESESAAKDERFSLTDNKTVRVILCLSNSLSVLNQVHVCTELFLSLHVFIVLACETSEFLTLTAHEGGQVEIRCPYEPKYEEHKKYFCRGECLIVFKDKPVESESAAKDERFSLTDNKTAHIFTVTITDLRTEDKGKYWCGVNTGLFNHDYKREIYLEIKHVSQVSGVTGEHLNITCHYENKLKNDVKFICKSSSTPLCEKSATKVSSEINSHGRFSLRDNESAGVFTVTITDLTEEDSGIYWCGAIQRGHGHKNKWISVTDLKHVSLVTHKPLNFHHTLHISQASLTAVSGEVQRHVTFCHSRIIEMKLCIFILKGMLNI
uniref:Immunoglobulin domain-containing protein n=1 Tax=Cyprinus carpio TaxID=7962 RepID=A0A8C1L218_CYPCA